jgi:hypothetical protein
MNHWSGTVAFFGDFKTSLYVSDGSAIPADHTGIIHCSLPRIQLIQQDILV